MILGAGDIVAYDAAVNIIAEELAHTTSLTTDSSRRAAYKLLTRFGREGISLTGVEVDS